MTIPVPKPEPVKSTLIPQRPAILRPVCFAVIVKPCVLCLDGVGKDWFFCNYCRKSHFLPPAKTRTSHSFVSPKSAPAKTPIICENRFFALSEESLSDTPLNLGFDDVVPVWHKRHCISAVGIDRTTTNTPDPEPGTTPRDLVMPNAPDGTPP